MYSNAIYLGHQRPQEFLSEQIYRLLKTQIQKTKSSDFKLFGLEGVNLVYKIKTSSNAMHNIPQEPKVEINEDEHKVNCQCSDCCQNLLPMPVQRLEQEHSEENALNLSLPSTSRPYRKEMKCPHCDKVFTHRGDMNKHLRTHSGEKPYECHVCKKAFAHTSNLSRHLKVHTGDKPFDCDNCGKKFSRKDKLDAHKQTRICKKRSLNPS